MNLWIDDERPSPDTSWTIATTSASAIEILHAWVSMRNLLHAQNFSDLEIVSFDHDLGGDDTTRPVLLWMIENEVWPKILRVHTANPVGRQWLLGTADRYAPMEVEIPGMWRTYGRA
jgi:hypothetical protein